MASLAWWLASRVLYPKLHATEKEVRGLRYSFSTNAEDLVFERLLPGPGRYLEIGGYHPVISSNTWLLYRQGWSGWVVEPNPGLSEVWAARRPKDQLIRAAVGARDGEVWYDEVRPHDSANRIRSLDTERTPGSWRSTRIPMLSFGSLCKKRKIPMEEIRLLAVDAEGQDAAILASIDWKNFRPEVVLAEGLGSENQKEIRAILEKAGYEFYGRSGYEDDPEAGVSMFFWLPEKVVNSAYRGRARGILARS